MTVATLENSLSSYELTEWMAHERINGPLGARRGDMQAATVAWVVANANRGKGKKFKITDFLIPYDRQKRSGRELLAAVKEMNKSMGGEYVGGSGD